MRGINIDNAVVIVEEAQNMTNKSMKTLLTRIGENCKFIISGDLEQSDLFKNEKDTGLYNAIKKLKSLPEVGCMEFKESEIVRNPLISKILKQLNGDFE
jgi:phosphate starvation-inducible PhoH-like protein